MPEKTACCIRHFTNDKSVVRSCKITISVFCSNLTRILIRFINFIEK